MDNIGWCAQSKDEEVVGAKLTETATAFIKWTAKNGLVFDHGKTEAAIFQ